MENSNYGPSDMGYNTPHQTTIIYNTNSLLESAIALTSAQAQLLDITTESDLLTVHKRCKHPSPRCIMFGKYPAKVIQNFLDYGMQQVAVFCYESMPDSSDDHRVTYFNKDDIPDYLVYTNGIISSCIIDYIICALYPSHNCSIEGINHITGKYFCLGVLTSHNNISEFINICGNSMKCYELIDKCIERGKNVTEERERAANNALKRGFIYDFEYKGIIYKTYAVQSNRIDELTSLAPIFPKVVESSAHYVLVYYFDPVYSSDTMYPGWRVMLMTVKGDCVPADDLLFGVVVDGVSGGPGCATAWVATGLAKPLLPFIYP